MPIHENDQQTLVEIATSVANVNTVLISDTQRLLELTGKKARNIANEDIVDVIFWVKCLARTLIAQVDGVCWLMRQSAAKNSGMLGTQLTTKKLQELSEDKGENQWR